MYEASLKLNEHSRVIGKVINEREKARKTAGGVIRSITVTGDNNNRDTARGLALNSLTLAMRKRC